MLPNLKLSDKAFILVAVPLVFQMVFVGVLAYLLKGAEDDAQQEARAREIIASAEKIAKHSQEAGVTLYFFKQTSQIEGFEAARRALKDESERLKELSDDSDERTYIYKIARTIDMALYFADEMVRNIAEPGNAARTERARLEIVRFSANLLSEIHELANFEQRRCIAKAQSEQSKRTIVWELLVAVLVFNVAVAFLLARFFNTSTSNRLSTLMDNSLRLATGKELNPKLKGRDEIGRLDEVFHTMADSLAEAQRKERAIIENAVDVICTISDNLTFAAASPSSLSVFGQKPADLLGKRLIEIVAPDQAEKLTRAFEQIKAGDSGPNFETQVMRSDGSSVEVRWSVHWSNQEKSFFCIARDITAERQVERLKQEFVSMISHDLRTPLMSVQASLTLLSAGSKGQLSEAVLKNLSLAERNVTYIIGLINSLLDMERISADKMDISCSPTELSEIIDTAAQAIKAIAEMRGIKLQCVFTEATVYADAGRMIQVMINLLSNALKFSGEGTTIKVVAEQLDDFVEVQVIDQGRGIPASHLASVFGRFEQVEATDRTLKGGTGLGLAICKAIVEAHGGTIGVESEVDHGSKFWFRLPHHAPIYSSIL